LKLIEYCIKSCSKCGNKDLTIFDNICDKCGNILELFMDDEKFIKNVETIIEGLDKNKLILREMLKSIFSPFLYNYIVFESLKILINKRLNELHTLLKEIINFPDISPSEKNKEVLNTKLKKIEKNLIEREKLLKKALEKLLSNKIPNPYSLYFNQYVALWNKWKDLRQDGRNVPEELSNNLKEVLNKLQQISDEINKGFNHLKENLIRIINHLKSSKSESKIELLRLCKIQEEYQIILSILKSMKMIYQKGQVGIGPIEIEIEIYKINTLLEEV